MKTVSNGIIAFDDQPIISNTTFRNDLVFTRLEKITVKPLEYKSHDRAKATRRMLNMIDVPEDGGTSKNIFALNSEEYATECVRRP
jgi:hypothetical protein